MENRRLDETGVSELIEKPVYMAENAEVSMYGDYKVISTFSDSGMSLTEALGCYIDRMTSLKY
jgi:hypothetical protein